MNIRRIHRFRELAELCYVLLAAHELVPTAIEQVARNQSEFSLLYEEYSHLLPSRESILVPSLYLGNDYSLKSACQGALQLHFEAANLKSPVSTGASLRNEYQLLAQICVVEVNYALRGIEKVTVADLASRLGKSKQTVLRMVDTGELPATRKAPGKTNGQYWYEADLRDSLEH